MISLFPTDFTSPICIVFLIGRTKNALQILAKMTMISLIMPPLLEIVIIFRFLDWQHIRQRWPW